LIVGGQTVSVQQTGERIRALMKQNGYTAKSLAIQLNLSESAVRNYIRGRNLPTVDCMFQMCTLFHLESLEELLVFV
jgi:transcriptional regulator with XRE-family HTH domain